MANLTSYIPMSINYFSFGEYAEFFQRTIFQNNIFVVEHNITYEDRFTIRASDGVSSSDLSFLGSGFTVSGNTPTGGTITKIREDASDHSFGYWSLEGLNISAKTLYNAVMSADPLDELKLIKSAFSGSDTFFLSDYSDNMSGFGGNDLLQGNKGNDKLDGAAGNDDLYGGQGKDTLTGGSGSDYFYLESASDSKRGTMRDVITDFDRFETDKIVLNAIDANSTLGGDQKFTFIGAKAFSENAGELRFASGILSGDINGDGIADFEIAVNGVSSMAKGDFIL